MLTFFTIVPNFYLIVLYFIFIVLSPHSFLSLCERTSFMLILELTLWLMVDLLSINSYRL